MTRVIKNVISKFKDIPLQNYILLREQYMSWPLWMMPIDNLELR
jgi:hypothetical protein